VYKKILNDTGLLLLRALPAFFMLYSHGWSKAIKYQQLSSSFPDPLGVGNNVSLLLTIFAEVICSLALITGLFTRLAAFPLSITMLVAAFIVHGSDSFAKKEMALLYLVCFIAVLFLGPGKFSLDSTIRKKRQA